MKLRGYSVLLLVGKLFQFRLKKKDLQLISLENNQQFSKDFNKKRIRSYGDQI